MEVRTFSKPRGAATVAPANRSSAEHLPAVRSVALRYRNLGLSVDDLVQEGSIGLLEAIDRYEPERSPDFESYARFRIRRAIRNALTEQSRLIRLPKQIVERRRAIERAEANIKTANRSHPDDGGARGHHGPSRPRSSRRARSA